MWFLIVIVTASGTPPVEYKYKFDDWKACDWSQQRIVRGDQSTAVAVCVPAGETK